MQIRNVLLNGPLGFGAAPLGNMFRNLSDEGGAATVDAAWKQGTRYFDTAPFYGAGLSEIRLGRVLAKHKRNDYLLSTKVGRLILDEAETEALFHRAGAVPRLGIPVHAARPAGRRRKPLPSGMVGEVHTRGGKHRGGLTAGPGHLRGWAEGTGH